MTVSWIPRVSHNIGKTAKKFVSYGNHSANNIPGSIKTFPKGNQAIRVDRHNPTVRLTFDLCADTHVGIEAKTKKQRAQKSRMVFTVLSHSTWKRTMSKNTARYDVIKV